jgi:cytoskeletal protein RodZ
MRRYSYQKNKNSRKEKVGFFTAFSICIVAVGLALWSTYSSIGGLEGANVTEPTYVALYEPTEQAGNEIQGITEEETEIPTQAAETEVNEATEEETETETAVPYTGDNESLQTVLQVIRFSISTRCILMAQQSRQVLTLRMVISSVSREYPLHTIFL